MPEHSAKAYDADLNEITQMIAEMGGVAEKEVEQAIEALVRRNIALAHAVIALDSHTDTLQREVESKAIGVIARRQPVAVDLRGIIALLRAANELERIGDLAKNIAKRVIALDGNYPTPKSVRGLRRMALAALRQLHEVLDSLALRDDEKAMVVWNSDQEIDAMYNSLFRELLTYVMEDPGSIAFAIHLLFSAKNIERIGDHVTNIAEAVHYLVEGNPIESERPKRDATSPPAPPSH